MRVLVVLAFKNAAKARASPLETLGDRFVRLIKGMFTDSLNVDTLEVVTRRVNQLEEFLPPVPTPGVPPDMALVRKRLGALDGIDFVFIDGDDSLQAWSRSATPLLHLLQLCALSCKCVLGCGCTVQMLSYLTMVGCSPVPLVNSSGGSTLMTAGAHGVKGVTLRSSKSAAMTPGCGGAGDGDSQRPKSSASGNTSTAASGRSGSSSQHAGGAMLERHTGDLFVWDQGRRVWEPVNNVGVHSSLGVPTLAEGRLNDGLNRSDGVGMCEVTTQARFHFLFQRVWPITFPVSQTNEWHCHVRPGHHLRLPTGDQELKVLAASRLGQQVLECCNVVALQFRPDPRYPQTLALMQNFINEKVRLLLGDDGAAKGATPPRRILLDSSRDEPFRSDIIQIVLQSLVPKADAIAGVASTSDLARPHVPEGMQERTRSASVHSIGGAVGPPRTRSWSAGPRAHSALSDASSRASVGTAPPAVRSRSKSSSYCLPPGTALAYLTASRGALERSAAEVHVAHRTKGFAEMQGLENVPIYVAKPPRSVTNGGGDSRPVSRQTGGTISRASSAASRPSPGLRPLSGTSGKSAGKEADEGADASKGQSPEPDLVLEAFDVEDPDAAANAPTPPPTRVKVIKLRPKNDKPFSNYQKHAAARKALERQSIHVTSIGPYVSRLDQQAIDDQKAKDKSIHKTAFFPAGLTHHSMKELTGFAAGGFALPDDLPPTAHRFGSFYNTHAHNFRATAPKSNLYM